MCVCVCGGVLTKVVSGDVDLNIDRCVCVCMEVCSQKWSVVM